MIVIIHGWSDDFSSFDNEDELAGVLRRAGFVDTVRKIRLGNYLNLDNEVTFNDIVAAMQKAWELEDLPTDPRSVDVIVHSTGALVIRDWLTRYYSAPPALSPIHRLLMLAPANFGSPLAHTGRSFIGRLLKGWKGEGLLQTGNHILKGLELASPYSWGLAELDRFSENRFYGPGNILCTVLVGASGYTGIRGAANSPGSDGTVRVSTANLNCARLLMDFSDESGDPNLGVVERGNGTIAFAVLGEENHSSVAAKEKRFRSEKTEEFIGRALRVTDDDFDDWCQMLEDFTLAEMINIQPIRKHYHGFQNTVFYVEDDFGTPVDDYIIEFYFDTDDDYDFDDEEEWWNSSTQAIQEEVITKVHAYKDNGAYRSVLIDCTRLYEIVDQSDEFLYISITASPDIRSDGDVGYKTYKDEDIGAIKLDKNQVRELFKPNRTLLVTLKLKRHQSSRVFELKLGS